MLVAELYASHRCTSYPSLYTETSVAQKIFLDDYTPNVSGLMVERVQCINTRACHTGNFLATSPPFVQSVYDGCGQAVGLEVRVACRGSGRRSAAGVEFVQVEVDPVREDRLKREQTIRADFPNVCVKRNKYPQLRIEVYYGWREEDMYNTNSHVIAVLCIPLTLPDGARVALSVALLNTAS